MPGMAFAIPTPISPRRRLSATVGNGFCHSHHHPQAPCKITILSHCFFTTTNSRWHASMGMFHILSNVLISNASL